MNNFSLDIGPAIRRYRKAAHLTQEKLAEKSGLSVKFISMLESNEQSNVSIQNLARIAHALGLDLATLISQMEATHPGLPVYSQQLMATLESLPVEYAVTQNGNYFIFQDFTCFFKRKLFAGHHILDDTAKIHLCHFVSVFLFVAFAWLVFQFF